MADAPIPAGYRLQRDALSSVRLNAQHYLWASTVGFNLHPRVRATSSESAFKVADIGTGTGIFVADLKSESPELSADGFDMKLDQCPPPELWPNGCSFRKLDILHALPDDLKGAYDVVNTRLIQGGLDKDDPNPALKNLVAMLKPGGYLQWQEIALPSVKVKLPKQGVVHSAWDELEKEIHDFDFGKWVPRLAEICTEVGPVESQTHKYQLPPRILIPFSQTQLGAYAEVSWVAMDNSTPDSKGPRFKRVLEQAWVELNSGVSFDYWLDVTVARKPL